MRLHGRFFLHFLLVPVACRQHNPAANSTADIFGQPVRVEIKGYQGNTMEPFLSRDGNTLFFNNLNSAPENTNLHWATRINDSSFQYQGEIAGVNTAGLEAVPTSDTAGNLYFVSNRNYVQTLSTLYQCRYASGAAINVHLVKGISRQQAGWVNFDIEVSADGQSIYFVDAQFDASGNPATADLVIAEKSDTGFQRSPNSSYLLKNINTDALEYAASIAADNLTLYFTRVTLPLTGGATPEIFMSTRKNINEPFSKPLKIMSITGFSEAPSISPDQKILYYHTKEGSRFVLYLVRKK